MKSFEELESIVATLRSENGCPWDREQTHQSLKSNLLEETYEIIEAIESNDSAKICEELGDLLSVIMLQARIGQESGSFDIEQVLTKISEKLIRRHPHVFSGLNVKNTNQVIQNWEQIKLSEEGYQDRNSALDGVPIALPSLQRAEKLQTKAARVGFDWNNVAEVLPKIKEEIEEIEACLIDGPIDQVEMEVGDLLFSIVNLARFLNVEAESALRKSNQKFESRFHQMEAHISARGHQLTDYSLEQLDQIWEMVKSDERLVAQQHIEEN